MPSARHSAPRPSVSQPSRSARHSQSSNAGYMSLEDGVDFQHFFNQFPLSSSVAQYISALDLDTLLDNLELALTPLADVPSYCRAEALRRRASVRSELSMLEDAFADIERHGVTIGQLRDDLSEARAGLEACMRDDNAWCDAMSSPRSSASSVSSPGSDYSFDLSVPPLAMHGHHRRSSSDPGLAPPAFHTVPPAARPVANARPGAVRMVSWSSQRRMSTGSQAGTLRPGYHPQQHAVYPANGQYYAANVAYAGMGHAMAMQ